MDLGSIGVACDRRNLFLPRPELCVAGTSVVVFVFCCFPTVTKPSVAVRLILLPIPLPLPTAAPLPLPAGVPLPLPPANPLPLPAVATGLSYATSEDAQEQAQLHSHPWVCLPRPLPLWPRPLPSPRPTPLDGTAAVGRTSVVADMFLFRLSRLARALLLT